MDIPNTLHKEIETLYRDMDKETNRDAIKLRMAVLSKSPHLTPGQRGVLHYYSQASVPWDDAARAVFKTLLQNMKTHTNMLVGETLSQLNVIEPVIQLTSGGYTWYINIPKAGPVQVDKVIYSSQKEAQQQADRFTKLMGDNDMKAWVMLGINYWLRTKTLEPLQAFTCKAEILNIRGTYFLILYEFWDQEHTSPLSQLQTSRTLYFTKKVQNIKNTMLFPQWSFRGFIPSSSSLPMFYIGYSFTSNLTHNVDLFKLSLQLQEILCNK